MRAATCAEGLELYGRTRPAVVVTDIALPDQDGTVRRLADHKGQPVVLFFYPKDDTSGCTKEACSFRDLSEEFRVAGASVFGINTDSVESHKKFHEKQKLTFSLLADPEGTVPEPRPRLDIRFAGVALQLQERG